jgi:hypothetical protein
MVPQKDLGPLTQAKTPRDPLTLGDAEITLKFFVLRMSVRSWPLRLLFLHSMRMCISCFAISGGRDLRMSRLTPLRQMQRPSFGTCCMASTSGPLRVIAINADEGWSRDVSEAMAAKVRDVAEHEGRELTPGTLAFIEAHVGRAIQPTLPLW